MQCRLPNQFSGGFFLDIPWEYSRRPISKMSFFYDFPNNFRFLDDMRKQHAVEDLIVLLQNAQNSTNPAEIVAVDIFIHDKKMKIYAIVREEDDEVRHVDMLQLEHVYDFFVGHSDGINV